MSKEKEIIETKAEVKEQPVNEEPKMIQYVGTKLVNARPMTRGEYNTYKGLTIPEDENPEDEGYLVQYSDDYISWSPKAQFETAYVQTGTDVFADTSILMKGDYANRFRAEYYQTIVRLQILNDMLTKWDKKQLEYIPPCPQSTYTMQIEAMAKYIACLEARAKMENIQL